MIKVTEITVNSITRKAVVSLFSDTKDEVATTPSSAIIGFPDYYDIDFGSSVITADGDIGFMKSTGEWNWVE